MNHLVNITKKELKELLTPGSIVSIVVVMVLLMSVGTVIGGEVEESSAAADIGVVYDAGAGIDPAASYAYLDTPAEIKLLIQDAYAYLYGTDGGTAASFIHYLDVASGDDDGIIAAMESKGLSYVISVPDAITSNIAGIKTMSGAEQTRIDTYFIFKDEGLFGSASDSVGTSLVGAMNSILSKKIADMAISGDSSYILQPLTWGGDGNHTSVNGTVYSGITPYALSGSMMSQSLMVPIVVMIVILMVGSVVISSMGSEKENKTLETLLTMPIRRTTIISGKLLAAAIVGLVYGVAYMIGMMFYMTGLTVGSTDVNLSDYGLSLGMLDWVILMAILFLAIFSALGICMILGAFTKNYKMAQQMTMPISFLAIIPMFVFMFMSWSALPALGKALMFLIPFSHPMMAMNNLMLGDMSVILGGMAYLLIFDAITIFITVKIYNSDILITGLEQTKFMRKLNKLFNMKKEDHENS